MRNVIVTPLVIAVVYFIPYVAGLAPWAEPGHRRSELFVVVASATVFGLLFGLRPLDKVKYA